MNSTEQVAPGEVDIQALLDGDKKAFENLVHAESGRLFRVIVRIVRDEDEAKSVMQETFLQAYKRRDTFRRESKFTTWLYAIGINLARGAVRKLRRTTSMSDEDFERLQPEFINGRGETPIEWNPEKMAERSERHAIVHAGIDRLPDDYRTVLTMRDIEELATPEVAELLQISEGAVRVRLHRARQALRKLLENSFA